MNTREYGRIGEESAALFLEKNGYKVIGKNVHIGHDEIDIIAENENFLVFVEVKTRRQKPDASNKFGSPASAVDEDKQSNLIRAAEKYILDKPTDKMMRIDVIEVYADPDSEAYKVLNINHIENAVTKRGKFSRSPRKTR